METQQGWSCSVSRKISSLQCKHGNKAPNLGLYFYPQKSYAGTCTPHSLSRPYACVILLEKHNFIKLGEKPNSLKIGSGKAPAPRWVCEAFRGFMQLRVFPQAITNQYFPLLPSENHKYICSMTLIPAQTPLDWLLGYLGCPKMKEIKTKFFLTSKHLQCLSVPLQMFSALISFNLF